jgi:GntR family transcriptional regulator
MSPGPRLRIDPTLPTPIWSQIEDGMRHLVANGALRPGETVPSVRDLAREQKVNPNTVAKAYQRLVEAGVFETRRGEGTFVTASPPALPAGERQRLLRDGAGRYGSLAVTLGVSRTEAVTALHAEWPEAGTTTRGGRR